MARLDKDIWHAVSPLLDRALDLDAEGQVALVGEVRRERPDLAGVLERLLDSHRKLLGDDFLVSTPVPERAARSSAGQTIGAYTLDVPLGMGGMGTVWRARRSDGSFEGDVAVKLLNVGLIGSVGRERLKREGTVLARLTHPNIARLLDAGVTDMGQPYLVLEYIEGTRIDHFADAGQLDPRQRLSLFLQVADAVAYAHTRLVVHRDLKPSNILVRTDGRVALLDFGIAKLLEDESGAERPDLTATGRPPFTPEYAAPEQAGGDVVTTATDVYALGVLLYVLLTGRHPTGPDSRTYLEHVQTLLEHEPVRASVAVTITTDQADTAERRAARRGSFPDRLRQLYRGDLDNILAKALEKTPAARYATITALIDDVRRYLRDEPVSVRASAWRDRTRKFLRRHRGGVTTAALIAVILVAATVISLRLMFEARRQRDEARFQARRASASSEFMRNLVTQIGSKPMTMKEVLDRGRVALEQQYSGDPAFVARMLSLLSGPYMELGEYDTSAAMMRRVLEIATSLDDPDLLAGAHCGGAEDATELRDYPKARAHLAEARRQIDRMASPSTGLLVTCAVAESNEALGEERFDEAIEYGRRALALMERDGNTGNTRYTTALNSLARIYGAAGRLPESVRTNRQVTAISQRIGRGRTISQVTSLNNTGFAEHALGWWLTAERTYREAFDIMRGLQPTTPVPGYLSVNYGRVLTALGRTPESVVWLRRAIDESAAMPRFVHRGRLALAAALMDFGDMAEGRAQFQQVERELKTPSADERLSLVILRARVAAADGRLEEARAHVRQGLQTDPARRLPTVHWLLEYGARLAIDAGDHDEAMRLAREAVMNCDRLFGTDEPSANAGRARLTLGLALRARGQTAEARTEFERAAALIAAAAGAEHPWVHEARQQLAPP